MLAKTNSFVLAKFISSKYQTATNYRFIIKIDQKQGFHFNELSILVAVFLRLVIMFDDFVYRLF